jgi:1,4-dihydroxy-2-naphthoate octaprenyltransferase
VAKAESVVRLTGSVATVHAAAATALAVGGGGLVAMSHACGDVRVGALLAAAVACGVFYQAPPFRLSYKGLGEPLCFISFGPLATTAFYLAAVAAGRAASGAASASAAAVSPAAACAAVVVGATTTAILFCSHFHQEATDRAAGKRSPIVRLGVRRASAVLSWGVAATHAFGAAAGAVGALPLPCTAALVLAVPAAARLHAFVTETHADPSRVFRAKFLAVRWHTLCGMLLAGAFVAARVAAGGA